MKKRHASPDFFEQTETDAKVQYYWDRVKRYGARYKGFHWPSVQLLLNFLFTSEVLSGHFAKRIKAVGLSPSSFNILIILSRSEDKSCKQRQISKLLLVSHANVTGLIDHLARRMLVRRVADPSDRRVWIARLTRKGEQLLESFLPGHYAEVRRVFAAFSEDDKSRFNIFLTKLRRTIA